MAESNSFMRESLRRSDFKEGVASFVEKRRPNFAPYTERLRASSVATGPRVSSGAVEPDADRALVVPVDGFGGRSVVVVLVDRVSGAAGAASRRRLDRLARSGACGSRLRGAPSTRRRRSGREDRRCGRARSCAMPAAQALGENAPLAIGVVGQAVVWPRGRSTKTDRGDWRCGNGAGRGEADRGKSGCFELTCDQTDRLVADRSNRHEQNQVGFLGQAPFDRSGAVSASSRRVE